MWIHGKYLSISFKGVSLTLGSSDMTEGFEWWCLTITEHAHSCAYFLDHSVNNRNYSQTRMGKMQVLNLCDTFQPVSSLLYTYTSSVICNTYPCKHNSGILKPLALCWFMLLFYCKCLFNIYLLAQCNDKIILLAELDRLPFNELFTTEEISFGITKYVYGHKQPLMSSGFYNQDSKLRQSLINMYSVNKHNNSRSIPNNEYTVKHV